MAITYEPIATTTLGSATNTVTFSSIPSTYTDLVLILNGGGSNPANFQTQVNGDTGSNYSTTTIYGTGSTAASGRYTNLNQMYNAGVVAAIPTTLSAMSIANFMNYSNTTTYKTVLSRYSDSSNETTTNVSLWRNTAAINTIRIFSFSASYLVGTTFTLYGIKEA